MSAAWIVALVALWVLVLFETVILVGLLRPIGAAFEKVEARLAVAPDLPVAGVTAGSVIPEFSVSDSMGNRVTSRELAPVPSIVLLVAPNCKACRYLAHDLEEIGTTIEDIRLFVLMQSSPARDQLHFRGGTVLYDTELEAARAFQSAATPVAFVLDRGNFVLDRTIPNSLDDLQLLALRQKGGAIPTQA